MSRLTRRKLRMYQQILSGNVDWQTKYYWHPKQIPMGSDKKTLVAWVAYLFAKEYGRKEDVDMKKLESIVARSKSGYVMFIWARHFPNVTNIKRFQKEIIAHGTHKEILDFAEWIPGANKELLHNFALVKEIMESV